jgi:hypothetical protein
VGRNTNYSQTPWIPPWHVVETLSENYKVGVSVCVFGVIFPHTWGTRIEVLGPLTVTFWDGTEVFFFSPCVLCVVTDVLIYSILKMKLLSNILAPVSCVTVAEGTQLFWSEIFRFLNSKKIEKRKKTADRWGQRDRKVIGSSEPSVRSQNRRTATLKDMIAADNENYMQSHVDVVHNRLNPDDLQGDSLLRSTM